jgi:hypothetical protein
VEPKQIEVSVKQKGWTGRFPKALAASRQKSIAKPSFKKFG